MSGVTCQVSARGKGAVGWRLASLEAGKDRGRRSEVRGREKTDVTCHFADAGKVVKFVVQLEVKCEGSWRPVLRYDCSHDYAHKDSYNLKARSKKVSLYMDYQDALIFADDDINENWQIYKERFLRGVFP